MKDAVCTSPCFNSSSAEMYETGKTYSVDETDGWVQKHFDVPKTKKAEVKEPGNPVTGEAGVALPPKPPKPPVAAKK